MERQQCPDNDEMNVDHADVSLRLDNEDDNSLLVVTSSDEVAVLSDDASSSGGDDVVGTNGNGKHARRGPVEATTSRGVVDPPGIDNKHLGKDSTHVGTKIPPRGSGKQGSIEQPIPSTEIYTPVRGARGREDGDVVMEDRHSDEAGGSDNGMHSEDEEGNTERGWGARGKVAARGRAQLSSDEGYVIKGPRSRVSPGPTPRGRRGIDK